MLFLVQGTLETSHYMGQREKEKVIRIVDAADEVEAERKFIAHFESQTQEYATYYYATADDVSGVIV